jgi:rhodanese-related sulfurtransferase
MRKLLFMLVLTTALLIVACQSKPVTGETVTVGSGSYKVITADELNAMLTNKDFVFVNVHIPFAGNIPGTDLSIPYNEIQQNLSQLPADKDAKIVSYCRSGRMSQMAAKELISLGYTDIWDLKGGMVEWEQAGFKIENLP